MKNKWVELTGGSEKMKCKNEIGVGSRDTKS